jgi:SAM-dependent methyltransferase
LAPAWGLAAAIAGVSAWQIFQESAHARLLTRNFYGSLRIADVTFGPASLRRMEHGAVEHGSQFLDAQRRREPISYYSRSSGVALAIQRERQLAEGGSLAVGIIGLGAGALAAYGQTGDRFRFYEINPQVVDLAQSEFTYLADSRAEVSTHLGDARLVLEGEPPQGFDVLVVDAFSGDAIPVHLLTREAVAVYRRHLKPSGVLAFHISNRFVDLEPALARLALEERLEARMVSDEPEGTNEENSPLSESDWVLMYADKSWIGASDLANRAKELEQPQAGRAWTDDFNSILTAVRLGGTGE